MKDDMIETELGNVPKHWVYEYIESTDIKIGDGNYSSKYPRAEELLEEGIPFISSNDVKRGRVLPENLRYISEEQHSRLLKGHIQTNDVLMVVRGNGVGQVGLVSKEFDDANLNAQMAWLGRSQTIDGKFLFYLLDAYYRSNVTNTVVSGSAQPQITITNLKKLKIAYPPLPEQKAIASVLSSLDDKIDLLHRQNKTLEAMAETLFRQWFIEDESLDEVSVSELIEFNPKRTLAKGTESTYLEMAGLSTQSFNATGYYKRKFTSGTKFIHQDTLLARITPCLENGKAGYVTFLSDKEVGWGSTEYIVMRPKSGIHPLMAYVLCRNQDFKDYAESCMEGSSGRQRVNVDHLQEFTIGKPTDEVIQQFNDYLESIESKLIYNSKQIQTLEQLRDTLLPKLMSGEVRVQYQTEEIT